jgi:Ca-activated chloride channel family protein
MVIWLAPLAAAVLCAVAELLHTRRTRRMARLAFGATGRPRAWVAVVPWVRAIAVAAVCWGLIVLLRVDAATWDGSQTSKEKNQPIHHLVIALDVSPSMDLKDAGPKEDQTRADRARDVLRSVLDRVNLRRTRISLVAFYTEARPVVVDTFDREVVDNILNDLPLEHAFQAGKTNLYSCVESAVQIGRTWAPQSASLIVVGDGDTLPSTKIPVLPVSYGGKLIVGVGHPYRGTFIDDHSSRQDSQSLSRLALQLGGHYQDANTRHVPTEQLKRLDASMPLIDRGVLELRDVAIWAVLLGAVALATATPALALLGSSSGRRRAAGPSSAAQQTELSS